MGNPVDGAIRPAQWGPRPVGILVVGLAGLLMAVGCLTVAADAPGRILTGVAAVGLLVFALGSWRARPRLSIQTGPDSPDSALLYRGWLRSHLLRRPDIDLIRITEFRRLGRKVRLLEIDTAGSLIVLSRWDLGCDPLSVLDELTDAGFAGR